MLTSRFLGICSIAKDYLIAGGKAAAAKACIASRTAIGAVSPWITAEIFGTRSAVIACRIIQERENDRTASRVRTLRLIWPGLDALDAHTRLEHRVRCAQVPSKACSEQLSSQTIGSFAATGKEQHKNRRSTSWLSVGTAT